MNIGVDVRVLGKGRAVSRYTRNILSSLIQLTAGFKFYLFTDEPAKVLSLSLTEGSFEIVQVASRLALRDHFFLRRVMKQLPLDIFFHPDNTEFLFCHEHSVVVIHDLIPWLFPNLVLSSEIFLNLRQRFYLKLQEKAILKSAAKIITVSNSSREDIIKVLGVDPDQVAVTYEGIDESFKPATDRSRIQEIVRRYHLPPVFIFYLGGLDDRKNLLRLIHAFAKVVEERRIFLVIGGSTSESETEGRNSFLSLKREINRLGLSALVIFTGFIAEEDLPLLYGQAQLFVYPSIYEGFGLPPLEAMACGVPVVASNSSSLPEVCGEAALLVNPYETGEFSSAIKILLSDEGLRQDYIRKGLSRSALFRWPEVARKTRQVFESL